jgi:DNA-binding NarL/FixJ family response regulator
VDSILWMTDFMPITICIIEDNADMRAGVARVLNQAPGLSCVSTYATAEAALRDLPAQKPDVALVDINLPGMNGIECVAKLKERLPQLQVLMLTRYEQSDQIFDSIRAGASGYLLKYTPAEELVQAVEQVHAGGKSQIPTSKNLPRVKRKFLTFWLKAILTRESPATWASLSARCAFIFARFTTSCTFIAALRPL